MDCCNYMQYRHHQPYYGSQYYDPLPAYHGDYYSQQMYQEYYGNSYYPQQWQCATSFPDYVYNPKEARIRKAMRDATRERSIGISHMVPRPNARRAPPHSWVSQHNELLLPSMGGMDGSVCGYSPGSSHYMGGYNKLEPSALPPSSSNSVETNSYIQSSNPLAQLQQHTEMWPDYRSAEIGMERGFIMGQVGNYLGQSQEIAPMMIEKEQTVPTTERKENNQQTFTGVFEQNEEQQKVKKSHTQHNTKPPTPSSIINSTTKPLPDFNEAFGSTERGRFQRLAPNKSYIDYFFDSVPIKFEDYDV